MRKAIIAVILGVMLIATGCTENQRTRYYGGNQTIDLPAGQKFLEVTWKDSDLYYLTRPMRDGETAETYTFQEKSDYGVFEGTIKIVEHNKGEKK